MQRLFRLQLRTAARIRSDADDELDGFIEARIDDLVAHGMSTADARAEAVHRLGDGQALEDTRTHVRRSAERREGRLQLREWIDELRQDLRFAARQLARAPGFTMVAIFTLALGIGATSAIFSVVYSVLLRPLPFAHADRLVSLRERNGRDDTDGMVVTAGNYGSWLAQARDFEALGAYSYRDATLTGSGEPQSLHFALASAGYWSALRLPPLAGRYFGADEDRPGAPGVVVLSQHLWQTTFGGDRHVIGRTITLNGMPHEVIGVAPAEYNLTWSAADGWLPLALSGSDLAEHADHEYSVVGLVREGVSVARAIAELTAIETRLAAEYPGGYFDGGIIAQPLRDTLVGSARTLLLLLLGAVALVLLIACGNISSLLLARAGARRTEIAIRGSIGAGRGRIVRQLLAESLLLAFVGAAAGLAVAAAGVRFLVTMTPEGSVPRLADASLNGPVLAFTLALSLGCGVLFGLYPSLRAANPDLQQMLREGSRDAAGSMSAHLREALVVGEIASALVLLVSAGLLVRSSILVQRVDPGFDPANLVVAGISLPDSRYASSDTRSATWNRIVERVAAIPGVANVAMVSRVPINGGGGDCVARAEGAAEGAGIGANVRIASARFLETMRIPLVRGRYFTAADAATSPSVIVINRGLAHRLFGDANPIGRRIANCPGGPSSAPVLRTVVGVIGDMHASGLQQDVRDEVYLSSTQLEAEHSMSLVVRGALPGTSLTPAIKRAVDEIDPLLPVTAWRMEDIISRSLAVSRFIMLLMLGLGGMGLTLAVIGIYGVIAYVVAQRRHEIGIRIALGATAGRVVRLVVGEGLKLAVIGVIIGCIASLLATRMIGSLLYEGVSARDPVTIAGVSALVAIVAVAASAVPALRAARMNPTSVLRT
ncbi:MAG TPA: ABC transporter permease [Gemmatimonadaceae bacterium]|nr:ABC transporter permease [Gemmatimonadaceae bacterium]